MKALLIDTLGGLLFLLILLATHSIAAAIVTAGAVTAGLIAWRVARRASVNAFQWLTLALVVGLGGISLATRNPLFVMVKPSLIQLGFGVVMLERGWLVRYVRPDRLAHIPREALEAAGYVYAATMFVLATANLAVALRAGPETWAAYSAIVPSAVFATLGLGMYLIFRGLVRRSLAAVAA